MFGAWWQFLLGWQSWLGYLVFLGLMYFFFLRPTFRGGEDFQSYRDLVKITQTKFSFTNSTVNILGQIKNDSSVKWHYVYFEVHCLDEKGNLIDTHATYDSGLVLVPGTEHAFRLSFTAHRPTAEYAEVKVFIREARQVGHF